MEGLADDVGPRGTLILRRFDDGREIDRYEGRNLIVGGGRAALARWLTGNFINGGVNTLQVGTNNVVPTMSDAAIANAYGKPFDSVTFPSSNSVSFNFSIADNEIVGFYVAEFGLALADGTLFSRKTIPAPFNKSPTQSFAGSWVINF